MQNKFLKSIHFTVLSFPEAAAKPAPRLPFSSHPLSQGAQVGSSSCPCPPSSSCLPGLRADLADLCFWEVANFRHQCPDHTQESIFLLLNNTAEVSQGRGFINSPPKIPAVTANWGLACSSLLGVADLQRKEQPATAPYPLSSVSQAHTLKTCVSSQEQTLMSRVRFNGFWRTSKATMLGVFGWFFFWTLDWNV